MKKAKAPAPAPRIDPNEPMEDLLQVRFHRLMDVITQLARTSIGRYGLRTTDVRILNLLYDSGMLSINELARRSHVDKAWISRSVELLLSKKWVSKQPNPFDARAQLISLTAKSRTVLEKIRPQVQLNEQQLLAGLDERKLKQQLDQVMTNADNLLLTIRPPLSKRNNKNSTPKKR